MLPKSLRLLLVCIVIVSGYFLGRTFVQAFQTIFITDFHVYYYIPKAVLTLARPEHPYVNYNPIFPYFFPPGSFILFWPLQLIPFYVAKFFWTILNLILLGTSLALVNLILDKEINYKFWIMVFLSSIFYPLKFTIIDGQFNIVLLFIYTYGLWALLKRKYGSGGVLLGIGAITKISPFLITLYTFWKRKYKLVFFSVATVIIFAILAEIYVKQGINFYYIRHVVDDVSKQATGAVWRDQSLLGFLKYYEFSNITLAKLHLSAGQVRSVVSYLVVGVVLLIFLFLDSRKSKSSQDLVISYSLLVVIGVVGTGLTWFHQYTMLLLPLFLFMGLAFKSSNIIIKTLISFVFLSVYALWFRSFESVRIYTGFVQSNMFYGACILLFSLIALKYSQNKIFVKNAVKSKNFNLKFHFVLFLFFLASFIYSIDLPKFPATLRQGRDRARMKAISHMGDMIAKTNAEFEIGEANSFTHNERLDEGYVLFKKWEENKVRDRLSILLLDPINDDIYNFSFASDDGKHFVLKAKLESTQYIEEVGEYYEYKNY